MIVDHVCLAVRRIDAVAPQLRELFGYEPKTDKVTNTRQDVTVQFFSHPGSVDLKLIEPASNTSPIIEFLKSGPGLHHLAFRCDDVGASSEELASRGARIIAAPQPGEAFEDHDIAFLFTRFGLNFELVDTDERRALKTVPD